MKAARFGSRDVERVLEFGVEHVEETVGEAPEEKEHGDEGDGEDRLLDCEGGGTGEALV